MSSNFLSELINALYAQEQRRTNREEEHVEGAFQAWNKDKRNCFMIKKERKEKENAKDGEKKKYPPCLHCKKITHLEKYDGLDQTYNIGLASNLVTWRRFARTSSNSSKVHKLKLSMETDMRIKCLLHLVMPPITKLKLVG
ncbi:hypothetical protein GQ457_02G030870 [Hibiscus cannabinus]